MYFKAKHSGRWIPDTFGKSGISMPRVMESLFSLGLDIANTTQRKNLSPFSSEIGSSIAPFKLAHQPRMHSVELMPGWE